MLIPDFSYDFYRDLLELLSQNKYKVVNYDIWKDYEKCVILRHDIDNDIAKAAKLAEIEYECGVQSTYFVLVTSNFYNVFSLSNQRLLQ